MQAAVTHITLTPANAGQRGPTLFELEYLKQIQDELAIFMKSSHCPTLQRIVIGVQGMDYQMLIPLKRAEK